jgi:HK97 gp10 family phage protein
MPGMTVVAKIEFNHLPSLEGKLKARAGQVVRKTANDLASAMVESMQGQESPSPPGQPPAIVSGNLAGSIQVIPTGELSADVVVGAEYGPDLEYGTFKMPARPFVRPAVEKVRPSFNEAMARITSLA